MTVAHCQLSIARRLHRKWYRAFHDFFFIPYFLWQGVLLNNWICFSFSNTAESRVCGKEMWWRRGDRSQFIINMRKHKILNAMIALADLWWRPMMPKHIKLTQQCTFRTLFLALILWIAMKSKNQLCSLCLLGQLPRNVLRYTDCTSWRPDPNHNILQILMVFKGLIFNQSSQANLCGLLEDFCPFTPAETLDLH